MSRKSIGAEVTGKMPFAGKHLVKYMYQRGREASREGKIGGKLASVFGLGAFAVGHAVQLKMGISALEHHEHDPALAGFDALYSTANAMATYTQAYLGLKVLGTRRESAQAVTPEGIMVDVPMPTEQVQEKPKLEPVTPLEFATTLGSQILFLATIH